MNKNQIRFISISEEKKFRWVVHWLIRHHIIDIY
jgi:hypothetical protein